MKKERRSLKTAPEKLHEFLRQPKFIQDDIVMETSTDGTTSGFSTRTIYDEEFTTIPSLELKLLSNRSPNGFVYHSFSLNCSVIKHTDVFAQLEIEPADKLSHRDPDGTEFFGAHWYIIGESTKVPDNVDYDWYNWLSVFKEKTNLTIYGQCYQPFEGELGL